MKRLIFTAAAFALLGACVAQDTSIEATTADTQTSETKTEAQFIDINDFKSEYVQPRNITIWLPEGYLPNGGERYPVIYAHDGQNLFQPGNSYAGVEWGMDETAQRMMTAGTLPPAIIVGIWNTDRRWQEYAPQKVIERLDTSGGSEWLGPTMPKLEGDAYLKFITEELKPYIDGVYKTKPEAETTLMMGSSMGGLISLYAAAEYPDVFGRIAAVSIHWPLAGPEGAMAAQADAAMQAYLSNANLDQATQRLWFDSGTETLDAFYAPHADAMQHWFREAGWSETQVVFRTYEGTDHSEGAWAERVDDILLFLLTD